MTDRRNTVVCFSGHRRYTASPKDEACLAAAVKAAYGDGYRTFISGMAPGFDLAAAEAVVRLRNRLRERTDGGASGSLPPVLPDEAGRPQTVLHLVAAVPFARQAAGYTTEERHRYEALLTVADQVVVLSDRYTHGCYYRRDDWMVERSGRIICWYDGSASGTRYTVRRAVAAGLEVVNIFRADGTLF